MAEYKQTQMWNLDEMKHIQVSNHLYLLTIMVVSCIAVVENLSISQETRLKGLQFLFIVIISTTKDSKKNCRISRLKNENWKQVQ